MLTRRATKYTTTKANIVEFPIWYNQKFSSLFYNSKPGEDPSEEQKTKIFESTIDRLVIYSDLATGITSHRLISIVPKIKYIEEYGKDVSHNKAFKLDERFSGYVVHKDWKSDRILYFVEYNDGKMGRPVMFDRVNNSDNLSSARVSGDNLPDDPEVQPRSDDFFCYTVYEEIWGEACVYVGPEGWEYSNCEPYIADIITYEICEPIWGGDQEDPCLDWGWCDEYYGPTDWTTSTEVIFDFSIGDEISDIALYLACFDETLDATLTIYTDQPIPGSSASYSGYVSPNVGHTFIGIQQGSVTRVLGFYPGPSATIKPKNGQHSGPSTLVDDSGHSYDVSISFPINPGSLTSIIDDIINYPTTYNLNTYNCTDFALTVLGSCNMGWTSATGTWPGGSGHNPGAFGQELRNKTFSGIVTKNTSGGTAPSNSGSCP